MAQLPSKPRKLVLCFDGTGNSFTGSDADTNVVKILHKLDRHDPSQFHYYQTGIGTYDVNEKSVIRSRLGELKRSIALTVDQGFGITFDAHVMSGYRFLMKYYETGAKIYLFGFSRGAFTARFLARMIHTVGLLCKGNEEMVSFAYRLYHRYLDGETKEFEVAQARKDDHGEDLHEQSYEMTNPTQDDIQGNDKPTQSEFKIAYNEVMAFSDTFCRKEAIIKEVDGLEITKETNIKVYFLGIWDCVNSIATLERHPPVPAPVLGTATYVRHAVSVDERRVKFKPALLAQDTRTKIDIETDDIKEVWFPGNHGDVGGGWPATAYPEDNDAKDRSSRKKWKPLLTTRKAKEAIPEISNYPFQLSDISLAWMIEELQLIGQSEMAAAIRFSHKADAFKSMLHRNQQQALSGTIHEPLKFGCGFGFSGVMFWKFMEYVPFITRWELTGKGKWVKVRFPLNSGAARDIPRDAKLHQSLVWRLQNDPSYCPSNNHGGIGRPCLKYKGVVASFRKAKQTASPLDHELYEFAESK